MGRRCIKHYEFLQFDDRKLMYGGIILTSVLFPIIFMGVTLDDYAQYPIHYFVKGLLYSSAMWIFLRHEMIFLRRRYPKISQTLKRNLYLAAYGIVITMIICAVIGTLIKFLVPYIGVELKGTNFNALYMLYAYFLSLSIFAVYEAVYFFKKYQQAVEEREQLKTAHVQAQLDNLRNQINPHFLFNSLNTLMNLIPTDSDRAMSYLGKLSKFYRYSVGKKDDATVSLKVELENARIYADLLQERFGNNINIHIEKELPLSAQILPMTLQLLIENAVKHNIVSKNQPLTINVSIDKDGKYIHVENNLQKKIQAVNSTGMGLENIKERFAYFTEDKIKVSNGSHIFNVGIPLLNSRALA